MCNKFIDISEHNTILSFNGMIASNLKGVIIKATEGTTKTDNALEINYAALHEKIPLGFYHYLTSTSSPETQAQNFWKRIHDKEYQIKPVLDVEQESLGVNAELYTSQFLQEFYTLSGQDMIIYSGRCYIEEHFSQEFRNQHLWWVADYSANETPTINGCDVIAWQYTDDERGMSFVMGDLDCSILENEDKFYIEEIPFSDSSQLNNEESETNFNIKWLQTQLNKQDFKDKYGNELEVDGIAGELTLSACPMLQKGTIGELTQWVQYQVGVIVDGYFGEVTRQAIITYQEDRSLDGDGIVGEKTWRKLLGM